jgi:methylated-DNA-protein-cysteine methyltransferase-like protein
MNTFDEVYKAVKKVPAGKVTTYGRIANHIGINNPRVVGYALHSNKTPETIPCHRVVNVKGGLAPGYAFGGKTVQKQLLQQEGVSFTGEIVDLNKCLYKFT